MKSLIVLLITCASILSATWKDVKDPFLRDIPNTFADVKLVSVLKTVPADLSKRNHVIYTADAEKRINEFRKKGTTYVHLYPSRITVVEDGATVLNYKVKSGIHTTQSYPKYGNDKFDSYFFITTDEDDNDDLILIRVAFCRDPWGGNCTVTIFRAEDQEDWLGFRTESLY